MNRFSAPLSPPHNHAVQYYGTESSLFRPVAGFLSQGLVDGQPVRCGPALLCGYSMGHFYKQAWKFEAVCRQHPHVTSPEGDPRPNLARKNAAAGPQLERSFFLPLFTLDPRTCVLLPGHWIEPSRAGRQHHQAVNDLKQRAPES